MAEHAIACELTISVVSHGHGPLLWRLLDDLANHAPLHGLRVVVTLNVPEHFDVQRWRCFDLTVLRNQCPRGFGANHNTAFEHCNTRWFAVLNPDLRLPDNPFWALMSAATASARTGVVAPVIVDSSGRVEDSVRENITPASLMRRTLLRVAGRQLRCVDTGTESGFYWLAGMFLMFDAGAYRVVGGFDERFFLYCEDYDVCARLRRAGYVPQLVLAAYAVHDAQRDSQRSVKHLRWHIASLLRVWTSASFWWTLSHDVRQRS